MAASEQTKSSKTIDALAGEMIDALVGAGEPGTTRKIDGNNNNIEAIMNIGDSPTSARSGCFSTDSGVSDIPPTTSLVRPSELGNDRQSESICRLDSAVCLGSTSGSTDGMALSVTEILPTMNCLSFDDGIECEVSATTSDDDAFEAPEKNEKVMTVSNELETPVPYENKDADCEDPENCLLNTGWTMHFASKKKEQTQWKDGRIAYPDMYTVQSFWQTVHHMPMPTELNVKNRETLHFFRQGIEPDWEAPGNANGGMWRAEFVYEKGDSINDKNRIWEQRNGIHMNKMWVELLMALVGEMFYESSRITGCIFQRRQAEDRIQLWTTNLSGPDEDEVKTGMAAELRRVLNIEGAVNYQTHAELQDQSKQTYGKRGTYVRSQSAYAGKSKK